MRMSNKKLSFRDVSLGLQKLRDLLLGRKHTLHGRFPPLIAPRTIPPPDIPRGPVIKYSDNFYYRRNAFNSVQPPVVAPVAEGPPIKDGTKKSVSEAMKPDSICFNFAPTPGAPWWWDGHCYYENAPEPPPPKVSSKESKEDDPFCPPGTKK